MSKPTHLILTIISNGRVLPVSAEPLPNHPDAIARLSDSCAALHAQTRWAVHFQLRDPADGRALLVLEHGATAFQPMKGR